MKNQLVSNNDRWHPPHRTNKKLHLYLAYQAYDKIIDYIDQRKSQRKSICYTLANHAPFNPVMGTRTRASPFHEMLTEKLKELNDETTILY